MKTAAIFTAALMLLASPLFAGDACCGGKKTAHKDGMSCIDYASLNLTADQKSKIEAWQTECTQAGCTKESRHTFLKQAKGILSPDQFAKLKEQCKGVKGSEKSKA